MPTMCVATTRSMTSNRDAARIACARPVDAEGRHIGQHQGVEHNTGRPADPGFSIPFLREPIPAFTSLVTWDESGSSSHRYASDVPNTNCSCRRGDQRTLNRLGHTPEDHRWAACADCGIITDTTTHDDTVRCSMCTIWDQRAHEYAFMEKEALVDWTNRLAGDSPPPGEGPARCASRSARPALLVGTAFPWRFRRTQVQRHLR